MSNLTTWTSFLLTGLRGNGKTLKAVSMMDEFIRAGVPVFACNFNGLTLPGVQTLDDPHEWETLPPGSVLFVDEAQRFFRSRRSGDPPPALIAMETQRHLGIRIVFLTQQPTYLDKHLRGLIDVHMHLVRRAGLQASQVYTWERCKDEHVDNNENVEIAEKGIWAFPSEYFGMYASAEIHTVKPKLPMRLKLMGAAAVLVAGLFWFGIGKVKGDADKPTDGGAETEQADGAAAVPAAGGTPAGRRRREPLTRLEYMAQMVPRIPGAPWSAPVYDDFNDVSEPAEVACMIGSTCRCITTQGTSYSMEQGLCRQIVASGGMFNPYKGSGRRGDEWRERDGEGRWAPGGGLAPTRAAPPAMVLESDQVSGYGGVPRAERVESALENGFSGGS